ncbi:MAG: cyclic nucleotide-binding domain-containing protein [Sulfuriferula sp.]
MDQDVTSNKIRSVAVKNLKMDRILGILIRHYAPFNQLSDERLSELVNLIRFVELHSGELFQIRAGKGSDCLFVLEGHVDVIRDGVIQTLVRSTHTPGQALVLSKDSGATTLVARENSIVCHVERQMIDRLISWDVVTSNIQEGAHEVRQRMERVRNSLVFRRLPWESVEVAFERMRPVKVKAGDEIIKCGENGDAFYIITSGCAEVWQPNLTDGTLQKTADIGEGDGFGCEALISGKTRNETVRMLEDGTLLTLGKADFDWLISKQMIKAVNAKVAKTMLETGYKLIDVRSEEEYEYGRLPDAQLIPLFELVKRMDELDQQQRYIIYCHSGNRSSVAALSLTQAGFDVQTLEGGFRDWPYEVEE